MPARTSLLALTFSLFPLFVAGAASAVELKQVGGGCLLSNECPAGLICHSSGKCIEQCVEDRDCSYGFTCKATSTYVSTIDRAARRCEPLPPPPPASGQFAGIVETAPGKGATCVITLGKRSARCDTATGEFLLTDVAPGSYKVKLMSGRSERTMTVYVNAAATTYLGAIPLTSFRLPVVIVPMPRLR